MIFVLDNVGADWGAEDSWERESLSAAGAISAQDPNCRTARHFDGGERELGGCRRVRLVERNFKLQSGLRCGRACEFWRFVN